MRHGVRIGIDVGSVRIGVARSDVNGTLAVPVETISVSGASDALSVACSRIAALSEEFMPVEIIVGWPKSLSGATTASTLRAIEFAREVARITDIPVRMVDERLTTVSANAAARAAGKSQKKARAFIDQIAAVTILQQALDTERNTGQKPGVGLAELPLE